MEANSSNQNPIELFLNQKDSTKIQGLFEDKLFPANEESLNSYRAQLNIEDYEGDTRKLTWKRLSEVLKPNQYDIFKFEDKPNAKIDFENEIEAPNCNNSDFLSALRLFAKNPKILKETILNKTQINKNGYFDLNLYVDGEPASLIIDDFFPIYLPEEDDDFQFYGFGVGSSNNIWPMLLAKIYVKFNLYFNKNTASDFMSTMEFMTPYPLNFINNLSENKEELEVSIKNALKSGFAVNSKIKEDEKSKKFFQLIGLEPNEIYDVLDIQSLKSQNSRGVYDQDEKKITIVKLLSPFTDSKWSGDWSLGSPLWNKYFREQLDTLTGTENFKADKKQKTDNSFWIGLDDFIKFFNFTVISYLNNELSEQHFRINYKQKWIFNYVEIQLKTRQEVYFVLNQMNPNFIESSGLKDYSYLNIFLLKKDSDNQTYRLIKNKFSKLGRINFSGNDNMNNVLEQGDYLIGFHYPVKFNNPITKLNLTYTEDEFRQIPDLNRDVVLGVFSKNPALLSIEPINDSNLAKFKSTNNNFANSVFSAVENLVKLNSSNPESKQILANYNEIDEKLSRKYTLINDDNLGFGYIFYKNDSEGYLNEKLIFNSLENVNALIHLQPGIIRGVFNESFFDVSMKAVAASGVSKTEKFLPYLTEPSSFNVKSIPVGKGNSVKYEVDLKIAPKSRAMIYFEKINESVKISYESRSAFTYPPFVIYRGPANQSRFTQSLNVSNLKYEGKEVDIHQSVLEYGTGVQYLYKNNTDIQLARITLKFKNVQNLRRLAESSRVNKMIEEEEAREKSLEEFIPKTSYNLYTNEERDVVDEIVIECKPKRIAYVQLEAKNPYEGFSYEAEVEYLVKNSYLNQ